MAKKWRYIVDNKLRGAFGETDFSKKVIRINKKVHEKAKYKKLYSVPKKDGTLINTIQHELLHKTHPDWNEKKVVSETRMRVARMSTGQRNTLYAKFS